MRDLKQQYLSTKRKESSIGGKKMKIKGLNCSSMQLKTSGAVRKYKKLA